MFLIITIDDEVKTMEKTPIWLYTERTYSFFDIPAVGYALNIHPISFGFVGQERKPEVALFLRDDKQKEDLETIIKQEAQRTVMNTIINGVGDNSKFYPPSAAVLLGICTRGYVCMWHIALFTLIGLPFFAMPRYLQKKSVDKMGDWIKDAHIYKMRCKPMVEYVRQEYVEDKINDYNLLKKEMGLIAQVKAIVKEPKQIKEKRLELAKDFQKLYKISLETLFTVPYEDTYPIIISMQVYNFIQNAYQGKLLKQQKQVIFPRNYDCKH